MVKRITCIPEDVFERLKNADLANKTSEEKLMFFNREFGDKNGLKYARLFDKSLTLKNQETSFDRFLKNLEKEIDPSIKKEISDKFKKELQRKRELMYNSDGTLNEKFLNMDATDMEIKNYIRKLVDKKYGLDISDTVKDQMVVLKKDLSALEKVYKNTAENSDERLAYGLKSMELNDLVQGELNPEKTTKQLSKDFFNRIKTGFKDEKIRTEKYVDENGVVQNRPVYNVIKNEDGTITKEVATKKVFNPVTGTFKGLGEVIDVAFNPVLKSAKASLDSSGLSRQGRKIFVASPKIWWKYYGKDGINWKVWGKVGSKEKMEILRKNFQANMIGDDMYEDAIKHGLALIGKEEFFPTNRLEKIYGVGNLFKASDDSFTMAIQGARFDLYKKYVKKYIQDYGIPPSTEVKEGLAKVANSISGRGGLGMLEKNAGFLNKIFFSARFQTAQINTFKHAFDPKLPLAARKIAQKNLAINLVTTAAMMQGLSLVGDVGWNPSESNFGKVRLFGSDKWIDLTAGQASYISATIKTLKKISQGELAYGEDDAIDVVFDFLKGKLAPAPGAVRDVIQKRDFTGQKPNIGSIAKSLFIPISITQPWDDIKKEEEAGVAAVSFILELIGTGVSEPSAKRQWDSPLEVILNR